MAERGSGANRAASRAPRRKVSSRNVGTCGVAARSPIRKPTSVVASSASRAAPPMYGSRVLLMPTAVAAAVATWPLSVEPSQIRPHIGRALITQIPLFVHRLVDNALQFRRQLRVQADRCSRDFVENGVENCR